MLRKIIKIDKEKCNGCGACADACHEGAIKMINGKANLCREDYCDGLGDCLPVCPVDAISFEVREAKAYNEAAVIAAKAEKNDMLSKKLTGGCPSALAKSIARNHSTAHSDISRRPSRLAQWPCQIKLVPINAPYFDNANLLIAADCTAFAYASFHEDFIQNHITLIGCPKLDEGDYAEKLTQIIKGNNIKSIKIVKMEVPCCTGLESAAKRALLASGKHIPCQVVTISTEGIFLQ